MTPEQKLVAGFYCSDVLARLSDYLDGDLTPAERDQVEAHLLGCDWCAQFGEGVQTVIQKIRAGLSEPDGIPDDVSARLWKRVSRSD